MYKINKKQSYFLSFLINLITGLAILFFDLNFVYLIIITLFSAFVVCYLFASTHKGYYLLDKLIYIFLLIFFANLLIYNYPNLNLILKLIMVVVLNTFLYSILVAFNIYLVSEKLNEIIPLIQPARLVVVVCTIVLAFVSANVIYKVNIFMSIPVLNLGFKVFLFAIYNYLIYYTIRWFFLESKIGENRKKNMQKVDSVASMAVLFNTQLAFIITIYPFEAFAGSIILMVASYISINLIQNIFDHKVELKNILEYVGLFVFAVISAIFIS